ncbi:MAG: DUF1840 domain-containing protein [Thiolinea sp.]
MIRFESKSAASVSMLDADAKRMLKLMGHSGTVPGAVRAADIGNVLQKLQQGVATAPEADAKETDDEQEPAVALDTRAYPLLELLKAAQAAGNDVMWDHEHSVL